jgi:hypothetical protein
MRILLGLFAVLILIGVRAVQLKKECEPLSLSQCAADWMGWIKQKEAPLEPNATTVPQSDTAARGRAEQAEAKAREAEARRKQVEADIAAAKAREQLEVLGKRPIEQRRSPATSPGCVTFNGRQVCE